MSAEKMVSLTWVPGTMDRIRITAAQLNKEVLDKEVHVERVGRVFGREALEAMYLQGRYKQHISNELPIHDL